MHWARKYIGIPYKQFGRDHNGVDCFGLLWLVYKELHGINLPMLPKITASDPEGIKLAIDTESVFWKEIKSPEDGDAVVMSQLKSIHHVGVYADSDGGKIIHAASPHNVFADTVHGLRLKGFKLIKFYRHIPCPT